MYASSVNKVLKVVAGSCVRAKWDSLVYGRGHIVCRRHTDHILLNYDGHDPVVPLDLQSQVKDGLKEGSGRLVICQDEAH